MLLVLLMTLATHARPAVITWQGGNGYYTLTIHGDGLATYDELPGHWNPQPQAKARVLLAADQLQKLEQLFIEHKLCELEPGKRMPVPEETSAKLSVNLPKVKCTVTLLANDWYRDEHTKAISSALDAIGVELQKQAHAAPGK